MNPTAWLAKYGDLLFYIALKGCGRRETAEDLVQDTLLSAIEARHSLENRTWNGVRAWLCAILRNKLKDHYRKASTRKEAYFHESGEWTGHWTDEASPQQWEPSALLQEKELREKLDECIAQLAPQAGRAVRMREFAGLSAEKTAAALGVTRDNLYVILFRARLALRSCLESAMTGGAGV